MFHLNAKTRQFPHNQAPSPPQSTEPAGHILHDPPRERYSSLNHPQNSKPRHSLRNDPSNQEHIMEESGNQRTTVHQDGAVWKPSNLDLVRLKN